MKTKIYAAILCLPLLLLVAAKANSQVLHPAPRNEISLQVSDGTLLDVIWVFGEIFTSWNEEEIHSGGIPFHLGAGYKYSVSDRFSIGMDLSFQNFIKKYRLKRSGGKRAKGKKTMTAFLIMPAAKLIYVKGRIIQLYGDLAAGVGLINRTGRIENSSEKPHNDNITAFAFQFNPIAIRVGKRIGGYLKLGAGYQGFVTIGASMKF
jgi:hypothetical protein